MQIVLRALAFAIFTLASCGAAVTGARAGPEITAQGFDIGLPCDGRLGQFERLRIRVEAAQRIKGLFITERSYEVDLATTLDPVNYRLFGIEKRLRRYKDVTLNFQNYINKKIAAPGEYEFLIRVTDHENDVATARLLVRVAAEVVHKQTMAAQKARPVKTGVFRFVRAGRGRVKGAEDLGITWKTIDKVAVVIRINAPGEEAAISEKLTALDYHKVSDIADLAALTEPGATSLASAYVDLPTANNAAAGRLLAIDTADKYYLMKLDKSATSLSAFGTTVVLEGEYKYFEK
jgi:hypothetical protein